MFDSIYKSVSKPLYKFIAKRVGRDEIEIEEILQQTMIAGWKGMDKFEHKSTYFTWLCRIALNKIADYYRDQINHRSRFIVPSLKAISLVEGNDISPIEKMALSELCDNVNKCLDLMPVKYRRLLWYRYWKNLSYAQIAKIMDLSDRAVEGQLYRAKANFSKVYSSKLSEGIK